MLHPLAHRHLHGLKQMKNLIPIIVLSDGETYSCIPGCKIMLVPEDQFMEEANGDAADFIPERCYILSDEIVDALEDVRWPRAIN
jgi:hypothetical protein